MLYCTLYLDSNTLSELLAFGDIIPIRKSFKNQGWKLDWLLFFLLFYEDDIKKIAIFKSIYSPSSETIPIRNCR